MCGINGLINSNVELSVDKMIHRGPDASGIYKNKNVQLGHVRLSILDLSDLGSQPFHSVDGNFTIVYNGEIYNHLEIREGLKKVGYNFITTSDTETLLYAFIEYGTNVLEMLNGIFAFAILDKKKEMIFIARDRFGVKPLYYFHSNKIFGFASEIKALHLKEHNIRVLNSENIANYIRFLWSPGEATPFNDVKKLLPGHFMTIDTSYETLKVVKKRFYLSSFNGTYSKESEANLIDQLEEHLIAAVKRQLLADVPIGFFLSGGLDSSILVAIAKKVQSDKPIQCFTINSGSKDQEAEGFSDDLYYAKLVANYLNVDLEIIKINTDIMQEFDKMIWHLDEPQADPAPINVSIISKRAKEMGYKVLIGGTAGDDIFSGYRRHVIFEKIQKLNKISFRTISSLVSSFLKVTSPKSRRIKKFLNILHINKDERIFAFFEWLPLSKVKALFQDSKQNEMPFDSGFDFFKSKLEEIPDEKHYLNQMLHLEMNSFLVDHNLNYTDKMGMAHGVEIRVPFLDNELVDFAEKLPPSLKLNKGVTKYLLKKVSERYLPNEVIYRSKSGFGAPIRNWIKLDFKDLIDEELSIKKLDDQGIFNSKAIADLIKENRSNTIDASYSIWALLSFQSWYKQFIKN